MNQTKEQLRSHLGSIKNPLNNESPKLAKKMVNQMSNNRPPQDGYKATRSEGKIHRITGTIGQNRGSTPNSYIKPSSTTLTTEVCATNDIFNTIYS